MRPIREENPLEKAAASHAFAIRQLQRRPAPEPPAVAPGSTVYAAVSAVGSQIASLAADVIGDFTDNPLTDGYSSNPAVLEPDDTAVGIRVHEPGLIICTCRCLGWDNWTGAGNEVLEAVKGCAPALVGADYFGVSYSLQNQASAIAGSANEGDPNTCTTDQFLLTGTTIIVGAAFIHSATVGALIQQVDVFVTWVGGYPSADGQTYSF